MEVEMEENPFVVIEEYIEDTNAIVPPAVGVATFKMERGLILMLKAESFFRNFTYDDPTQHHRNFLVVCAMHKQNKVSDDALRLRCFKYSLAGDARKWLQNMPPNSIPSWPKLVWAFLAKLFPQMRSPNHGFPDSILLYMGLDPMNQFITKNAADRSFMDKSFVRVTQILDKMAKHNQAWHLEDTTGGIAYGSSSLTTMIKENQERDQVIGGLATNVNVLTKMFTESQTKKVNVVEDVQPISNEDFEEANYVNNSQRGSSSESKLEGMLERVLQNQEKFDTSMMNMIELVGSYTASIQKLEMQMRDLSREQNPKQKGTLPSDTIVNPKGSGSGPTSHVRAITTRSGKVLQGGREQVVEVEDSEHKGEVEEPSVVESEKVPEELKVKQENREEVNEKISSIFATSTVQNKENPGAFNIPCTIGAHYFARALCDNGSSINLMPLAIYKQAGLGMPSPTSMRLQTTNHSIKRSVGIVDDVLVKVGKFHLPAKFVILDCAIDKEIPIILGRPFLATGRALMDSERNEIKFYVNDEEVTFQESKGMKLPHEYESISVIDVVNGVEDAVEMKMEEQCLGEALEAILVNFDGEDMEGYMELVNALEGLGSYTYAPVEQLLEVLKEHRQAIGWTIADIRGIPAGICEHKIQLESETKPSVEHQRRLNPYMQEVVMKEIIKWLDVGVVYPIADSSWVSPVQCVPKRGGMTMIENDKNELIPTRTVNE
uniref:Uncharacterized protein LOC104216909 n=1 Tax=Nicotiana sylvestris TaxID=4096 RepID=A0A1U7VK69_NICSY